MVQTFSTTDLFSTLSETITSVMGILTGNPVFLVILGVAVGIPILGAVMALAGRRG